MVRFLDTVRSRSGLAIRWAGWMLLAAMAAWYVERQVVPFVSEPGRLHANDFKHIYLGALFLRSGGDPYDAPSFLEAAGMMATTEDPRFRTILPYVYLPFTGVVLIPLTWLRFPSAVWAWFWTNHLLFLLGGWLAARGVGLPRRAAVGALVLFLLAWNAPLSRTLTAGQLNGVLFFCFALVLWMTPRAPAWATGGVAAFAALFKLTPAILFFWFLSERMHRQAVWMAVWTGLLMAATFPVSGPRAYAAFLPVLRDMGYGKSTWAEFGHRFYRDPYNQSLNSFYHHVLAEDPRGAIRPWVSLGAKAADLCTRIDALALAAVSAWLVWPARRRRKEKKDERATTADRETEETATTATTATARPDDDARAPGKKADPDPNRKLVEATGDVSGLNAGCESGRVRMSPGLPAASVLRYSLLVVLSLLIPSILWDHYLVLLVLPVLALVRESLEAARPWVWRLVALAVAVAVVGAAIPFDAPGFRSGPGLVAMSAKLWGAVAVWFLVAWALLTREPPSAGKETG